MPNILLEKSEGCNGVWERMGKRTTISKTATIVVTKSVKARAVSEASKNCRSYRQKSCIDGRT